MCSIRLNLHLNSQSTLFVQVEKLLKNANFVKNFGGLYSQRWQTRHLLYRMLRAKRGLSSVTSSNGIPSHAKSACCI